ncbi:MAG: hypothetical protein ACTHKQ_25710 [Mesorhizobium sp.]
MIDRIALLVGLLVLAFPLIGGAADQYAIGSGQTVTINEYSVCYKVTNPGSGTRMVPTGSAAEWQSVRSYPNGLTFSACAPACAGMMISGYCWHMGAFEGSCDEACASYGGCNVAGTVNYAGTGGSMANCSVVTQAWYSGPATDNSMAGGVGCGASLQAFRYTGSPTTCGARATGIFRFCACNS